TGVPSFFEKTALSYQMMRESFLMAGKPGSNHTMSPPELVLYWFHRAHSVHVFPRIAHFACRRNRFCKLATAHTRSHALNFDDGLALDPRKELVNQSLGIGTFHLQLASVREVKADTLLPARLRNLQ